MGTTVTGLYHRCKEEIDKGNALKEIYIAGDEEGNSFHPLLYGFSDPKGFEDVIEGYYEGDNVILLG